MPHLRIIIADDEEPLRRSLLDLDWAAMDAELVGVAEDGRKALDLCRELAPDVLITDIIMPVLDGISLLERLRAELSDIQVIILTVSREFEHARRALELGALDYLVKFNLKPEEIGRVLAKVRTRFRDMAKAWEDQPSGRPHSRERPEIRIAREVMEKDYARPIGLSYVAEKAGVSPAYLSHLFSTEAGEQFSDALVRIRMAKAIRLLESTSLRIYEVAERVGIPNYRYFSVLFKHRTGRTPKDFQRGR